MFFTLEKMIRPIRIANDVTEVCGFRAKISRVYRRLQLAAPSLCECYAEIQRESFSRIVFLVKK